MTQEALSARPPSDDVESLRAWKARHLGLLNSIDAIVWEAPADFSGFTFVSEQAERLLGYPVDRWIDEPDFWIEHMHPDDRSWCPQYCAEKTAAGEAHDFEYRMISADGRTVWLRDIVTVVEEAGKPAILRGVMTDVTALKDAADKLSTQEREYRDIFEATSDGLVIVDLDSPTILDANPSFCKMHGYEDMKGQNLSNSIHPDSYPLFQDYSKTIRAGGEFRGRAKDVRRDGSLFDVEVHARAIVYRGRLAGLGVVRDITDQVRGEQFLEDKVAARTRELATLLEVSESVTSTLELQALLDVILDQARRVIDYDRATFVLLEAGHLEIVAVRGFGDLAPPADQQPAGPVRLEGGRGAYLRSVLADGQTVIIDDIHGESSVGRRFQQAWYDDADEPVYRIDIVRSWMAVPVIIRRQAIGLMVMSKTEPAFFGRHDAEIAEALARHAGIAIENARLFGNVQERTHELTTLLDASQALASTLDLESLFEVALDHLESVVPCLGCSIGIFENDAVVTKASHLAPGRTTGDAALGVPLPLSRMGPLPGKILAGKTVGIDDITSDTEEAHWFRQAVGDLLTDDSKRFIRSWMAVPIQHTNRVVGMISVSTDQPGFYTPEHARLASSVATHIALAIENAQLYKQAQQLAATEERQRLARELHDSVSQALYGIALGASTAQDLIEGDAQSALRKPLEYVLSLAEAGLAEMRALIFELRPGSLQEEGLVAAVTKQVEAMRARYGLNVTWEHLEEPDAPLATKEAVYRIVQEALHNVVKHAKAANVVVDLHALPEGITAEVRDDGIGFDTGGTFAGHLGLKSMRERAEKIGGRLDIQSSPDIGTTVRGSLPREPEAAR